jgi:hypothetical protein
VAVTLQSIRTRRAGFSRSIVNLGFTTGQLERFLRGCRLTDSRPVQFGD